MSEMYMRVLCVTDSFFNLDDEMVKTRLNRSIHQDTADMDLDIGKNYNVVAIEERDGGLWLFLHTVESIDYPYPYPAEMFEFIDTSIPLGWKMKFERRKDGLIIKRISFPQWVDDDCFYEKLVDGDEEIIATYQQGRLS
jgi:hypothetical protein